MKILKIRSLEGRWVDKDEVLLHAAFQLLQDFVEQEHPEETIDWKHDATHTRAWREISSLYRWWKKTRPARRSPLDDKQIKRPPMRFEPVPNSTMRRLVPYDRKKYRHLQPRRSPALPVGREVARRRPAQPASARGDTAVSVDLMRVVFCEQKRNEGAR